MLTASIKQEKVSVDYNTFLQALRNEDVLKKIKPQMIDYFSYQTETIKRNKSDFADLKARIDTCINSLQGSQSVKKYFNGYELILEARQFFLGELGQINYTFVVAVENKLVEITIDHKKLSQLLFKGQKFGLSRNLRFNATFTHALQGYLYDVIVSQTGFELIVEGEKINLKFENPKWMQQQLEIIKNEKGQNYEFALNLEITKKDKLKWKYERPTTGFRDTSSIFSAVGHYAIDELEAKKNALATQAPSRNISINIGNLTQIYKKAKNDLNQGHNSLRPNQRISGESLYQIFQQVRSNTDPFYAGGDILESQIKSLLGSMPSLTSFHAVKEALKELQTAFQQETFEETKQKISEMFIKNSDKMDSTIDKQQIQLAKLLAQTLQKMTLS